MKFQMFKLVLEKAEEPEIKLPWEDPLEKEMATFSSFLTWKIPWTEKPGVLQSMGLHRVRHATLASLA